MKKTLLFLTIVSLLFSCSSDNNNSSNNNGNSFTNSMDYEFTITINGDVHKIKGNTTNGIPYGMQNAGVHWIDNKCMAESSSGVNLKINDITESNYISGQNLECNIILPNLLIGSNQASVQFIGNYFDTLSSSLGGYSTGSSLNGFSYFQTSNGVWNSSLGNKLPIVITDLGSNTISGQVPPLPYYSFGETLKGNYNGTIYISRYINGIRTCDIPVQISIDFKALRMY